MNYKKVFILSLILLIIFLPAAACTSNQVEEQSLPLPSEQKENEATNLPPIEPPEKGNPKLSSHLWDLIDAESRGEAEEFARQGSIELINGSVRVIVEGVPDQADAVAEAVATVGTVEIISKRFNGVQAVVPITSLNTLADEESIAFIRLPVRPESGPPPGPPTPPPAHEQPDPLTEAVINADLIVLGTITDQRNEVVNVAEGHWGGKHAYTIFNLSVEKVIKGDPNTREVLIRVPGGYLGEVYQAPTEWYFSISDRLFLNLHKEEGNIFTIPRINGVIWIEGVSVVSEASLEYMMGCVAKIMKDNNIPIVLDEPIPMPAEPHQRPEN